MNLRAPTLDDAPELAALFREFAHAYGSDHESQTEIEGWFTNPGLDLGRDARVALAGDEIVGYVDAGAADGPQGIAVYIDLRFHPEHPETIGSLFDFAEPRAQEMVKPGGKVRTWTKEAATALTAQIEQRGFTFENYSFRMGMSLDRDLEEPEWPENIGLRPFDRGDTALVYEVIQEALDDEPDHVRDPYDEWVHWAFHEPFDPELWFPAFDGGELAGISLCRPERGEDPDCGWVQVLGVRRRWRRRGLGRALLLHSLGELRARGKTRAGLRVHAENAGAVQLYERVGMSVLRTSLWYGRRF